MKAKKMHASYLNHNVHYNYINKLSYNYIIY